MIGPPTEPRNGEPKARSSKSSPSKSALATLVPIIAFEPPSGTPSSFARQHADPPEEPALRPAHVDRPELGSVRGLPAGQAHHEVLAEVVVDVEELRLGGRREGREQGDCQ